MKLSLLTYNLGRDFTAEQLAEICKKYGYSAVEYRVDAGHRHEVELSTPDRRLKEIREVMENNYLVTSSIATGCKFDSADSAVRKENIELAKEYVKLADKMDCGRIRVFGNEFLPDTDKQTQIGWVGEALNEIGEFAAPYGVDVLLEMHGHFNFWNYALKAVKLAGRDNTALVYNSDRKDIIAGSCETTYSYVKDYIRHIHMHCVLKGYPFKELFRLLKRDGYNGYLSVEVDEQSPDAEKIIGYYAMLFYAWSL